MGDKRKEKNEKRLKRKKATHYRVALCQVFETSSYSM